MDPQQGPPQQDHLIGQTVGNYLVTQKLGEGGMGSVYLAVHPTIGKKVALKVLHAEFSNNEDVARRFFDEAKSVNNIGHPNIVDIVDYGVLDAGPDGRDKLVYFLMEYLDGVELSKLIRTDSPLPPERALSIALQVADALAASHRCGIVHRDLKPDNIILLQRGRERDFVKLLDFGIAKLTGDNPASSRTRTGIVMGTPAYMSPEQCEGRATVDLRTDVYALGIVLYEMLTGRVPFVGEGYGEILVQHLTQNPLPPSQYRMLPPHVEVVVLKALEKRADMRYPTADEMMRAMADPVGYVEAHGGPGQFLQRQLMPSNTAIPTNVRLTPAPLTPVPGSLGPASGIYPPTAPVPTTLGAAAGEVSPRRSKAPFAIAAAVIVAGAAGAVGMIAMKGSDAPADDGAGDDTGSGVIAAGSGAGSDLAITPDAGAGTMAVVVDAAVVAPTITVDAAPGGENGSATLTVVRTTRTIQLTSKPIGAAIFVDDAATGKKTPGEIELPLDRKVKVTLKLDRHDDRVFKDVSADTDLSATIALKPVKKAGGQVTTPGRGSNTNRGSGSTIKNDTRLERPD